MDRVRDRATETAGVDFAAHHQRHPLARRLQERCIHFRTGARLQTVVLHIAHNPHNLAGCGLVLMVAVDNRNVLADWRLIGPEALRHALVDDGNLW
jgi:hypothetical protein